MFSILLSKRPISLMVNLLLSTGVTWTSAVLKVYAGKKVLNSNIPSFMPSGSIGSKAGAPSTFKKSPVDVMKILSILLALNIQEMK